MAGNRVYVSSKFYFVIIFCLFASLCKAQENRWSVNLTAGMGFSNVYVDTDNQTNSDVKPGYQFGGSVRYTFPYRMFLQSGLILQSKGAKYQEQNTYWSGGGLILENEHNGLHLTKQKTSVNSIYLQLPLIIGYKFMLKDDVSINISGGPYLAYGIGGRATIDSQSETGEMVTDHKNIFGNDAWKRFDSGVIATLGVEFRKISLNMGYDFGMINIDRVYDVYNRSLFINVGYQIF